MDGIYVLYCTVCTSNNLPGVVRSMEQRREKKRKEKKKTGKLVVLDRVNR